MCWLINTVQSLVACFVGGREREGGGGGAGETF